jgi:hypothetical protein
MGWIVLVNKAGEFPSSEVSGHLSDDWYEARDKLAEGLSNTARAEYACGNPISSLATVCRAAENLVPHAPATIGFRGWIHTIAYD